METLEVHPAMCGATGLVPIGTMKLNILFSSFVLLGQLDFGAVTDMETLTEDNRWISPPFFSVSTQPLASRGRSLKNSVLLKRRKGGKAPV